MMAIFGHRQFSLFFVPLIETWADGFSYKGKRYRWEDVQQVSVWDSEWHKLLGYPACIPRATVQLADGKAIKLNGRVLEKKGVKPKVGLSSNKSDEFDELVSLFQHHAA
jgi:hypothetical protein